MAKEEKTEVVKQVQFKKKKKVTLTTVQEFVVKHENGDRVILEDVGGSQHTVARKEFEEAYKEVGDK